MTDYTQGWGVWLIRLLGALAGVIASLIILAPAGTKNAFHRAWVGATMGVIFAPMIHNIYGLTWLTGTSTEHILARSALAAFMAWSVLEGITRFLSNSDWLVRLAQEIIRLKTGRK